MLVVAVEKIDGGHAPDPVIVIRSNWLTPRKQECFWPPYKQTKDFNVALSSTDDPDEKWNLIKIKKRLYETDDLQKAREKAKEAEFESDLYTDEPEVVSNIRRSKRKKRRNIPYSSPAASDLSDNDGPDSNLQLNIPSPPSGNLFSGVQTREKGPSVSSQPSCSKNLDFGSTPPHHSLAIYTSTPIDCIIPSQPSGSKNLDREYTPSHHSRAIYESTPISHTKNTQYSGFEEVLLRKIENVKELCDETNRLFHALLAEKNKPAEDLTSIENFPFCLPCKSLQDVEIVEEFLKDPESRKNFVTHLAVIGGTNAEKHVRRILCSAFTNELAQQYNWSGKGGKRALKDLVIPSVIIDAVKRNKRNFSGTTICELENVTKQWFRFAKDRQGGRDKRRSLEILK